MSKRHKLTLSPGTIAAYGAELDVLYPGCELYERRAIGEEPVFVRVLGGGEVSA